MLEFEEINVCAYDLNDPLLMALHKRTLSTRLVCVSSAQGRLSRTAVRDCDMTLAVYFATY